MLTAVSPPIPQTCICHFGGDSLVTIADITSAETPSARSEQLQAYVQSVGTAWSDLHGTTVAQWYAQYERVA